MGFTRYKRYSRPRNLVLFSLVSMAIRRADMSIFGGASTPQLDAINRLVPEAASFSFLEARRAVRHNPISSIRATKLSPIKTASPHQYRN